jgi:ABC-type transport system involved in cytochrome c biogenesis permease subunit
MNPYLLYISIGLYLCSSLFYLLQLVFTQSRLATWGYRLFLGGFVLQTTMLGVYFSKVGYPFLVGPVASYQFTAWVVALAFALLNLRGHLPLVGVFLVPLLSTFYLLALFSSPSYSDAPLLMQSRWASIHIVFSFLALAIFAISFVLGIMFIIEEFQLKYKVLPKVFLKWPSLESLETVHARALSVGFVLLTAGIVSGAAWAKSVTGFYFFEDARQLWSIIAWLIYALFLQSRFMAGWRGRRGVILSLLGFVVILFTFLGVEHN